MRKINILINGFHLPVGRRVLERGLRSVPLRRCIHIASTTTLLNVVSTEPPERHSGTIDSIDGDTVAPLDEELIEAMRPCEAVVLEMMDRDEGKGRTILYHERKRLYFRTLRYWSHVLDHKEIHLFLSVSPPHRFRTYIIACLCRQKGIPAFFFNHISPIPSMFYLLDHWEDPITGLRERWMELSSHARGGSLSSSLERYWRSQTEPEENPAPWYVHCPPLSPSAEQWRQRRVLLRSGADNFVRQIFASVTLRLHARYWLRLVEDRRRRRCARRMFRFYDAHARTPDCTKRYIYLPLQLQPELTTCPLAGAYVDQQLMVHMISALVPSDVLVYIKEHPNQERLFPDGACRDVAFYRDFLALPNVRLVPRTFDTFMLMRRAVAVATATGSAGFEALFRGVPFLMFGHDFYQYAPGVFPIHSFSDCRNALHAVLDEGAKPDLSRLRFFLQALDEVVRPGYLDDDDMKSASSATEEECVEHLGGLIEKRIFAMFP